MPAAAKPVSEYLTADELVANAPADIQERDVEAFGGKVKVRGLTAAQQARVKQVSITLAGKNPDVAWAEMEKTQFQIGVVEPQLSKGQVEKLHRQSGRSFAQVIAAIDELSGMNKEELREAQQDFREPEE